MKSLQRKAINHKLNMAGLASLENPDALLSQVALGINDHDKFRSLLLKCEPDQRYNCYYSLKHRLRFEAKPLETYIMEGKQQAEREKLPVYDHETGKLREFDAPAPLNINALAERAIMAAERERNARGHLEVTCLYCRFTAVFAGRSRTEAWKIAIAAGWRRNAVTGTQSCPKCTKERDVKLPS